MEQSLEEVQALRAKALEKVAEKNRKIMKLQVSDPKSTKTPAVPALLDGKVGSRRRLFIICAELMDEHQLRIKSPWGSAPANDKVAETLQAKIDMALAMITEKHDILLVSDGGNKSLRDAITAKLKNFFQMIVVYEAAPRFKSAVADNGRGQWVSMFCRLPPGVNESQLNLLEREARQLN